MKAKSVNAVAAMATTRVTPATNPNAIGTVAAGNTPTDLPRIFAIPNGNIGEIVWRRVENSRSFTRSGCFKPRPRRVRIFVDRGAGWDDGLFIKRRREALEFIEGVILGGVHHSIIGFKISPLIY